MVGNDHLGFPAELGIAMRPWIVVVTSAVAALAAAAALVRPELIAVPRAALVPGLVPLLPALAVTVLAVYALCAILLTSGNLIAEALRLRRHLDRNPPHHGPARPGWTAAFEGSGLRRLVPPPAAVQPRPAPADGTVVLQGRFRPREARREVARLCYIDAARTHFFSALIVLAAGVVLGAAQQHGPLPIMPGPIPTVPAALAVAGLVLLAILARIAVDVAAEPLVEMIYRLPAEPTEAGLLRRATELLENAGAASPARDAASLQIPDRLATVLEQGHRALFEAIERLSTTTDGLATTTTSSIEALEAAFRATELRQLTAAQDGAADTAATAQLRDAVAALTAVLERVRGSPAAADATKADADPGSSRQEREPDLAQELRRLLQEIETTP
jgi:hypothetical protein